MKHARPDYDRFQDPEGKIPDDEPVMLFRAQDKHMPAVLRHYAMLLAADLSADIEMPLIVLRHARLSQEWQADHGCKTPDL